MNPSLRRALMEQIREMKCPIPNMTWYTPAFYVQGDVLWLVRAFAFANGYHDAYVMAYYFFPDVKLKDNEPKNVVEFRESQWSMTDLDTQKDEFPPEFLEEVQKWRDRVEHQKRQVSRKR